MSSDLVDIFLLSLLAMLNLSLLAAVTVMLLLPNPKSRMVGLSARRLDDQYHGRPGDRFHAAGNRH